MNDINDNENDNNNNNNNNTSVMDDVVVIDNTNHPQPWTTASTFGLRHRRQLQQRRLDDTTTTTTTTSRSTGNDTGNSSNSNSMMHYDDDDDDEMNNIDSSTIITQQQQQQIVVEEEEEEDPMAAVQVEPTETTTVHNITNRTTNTNTTTTNTNTNTNTNNNNNTNHHINHTTTPPPTTTTTTATSSASASSSASPWWTSSTAWKVSRYYCWMSAIGALFAILVAAPSSSSSSSNFPPSSRRSTAVTVTTSTSPTNLSICGGSSNNNNILSNALTSSLITSSTSNSKSIHNDDLNQVPLQDPYCTATTSDSSGGGITGSSSSSSSSSTQQSNVITFATTTTTIATATATATANERINEQQQNIGWWRWTRTQQSLPPVPKEATSSESRYKKSSYKSSSNNNNNDDDDDDAVQPSRRNDPKKNFWHVILDIVSLKHGANDTTSSSSTMTTASLDSSKTHNSHTVSNPKNHPLPQNNKKIASSSMVSSMLRIVLFSWLDPNLVFTIERSGSSNNNNANNNSNNNNHHHNNNTFPFDTIITNLIDKVLTSTVRLILIANWLIALTVLLHTAVADYFLGNHNNNNNNNNNNSSTTNDHVTMTGTNHLHRTTTTTNTNTNANTTGTMGSNPRSTATITASRERMGGYLLFKFLLISAMVAPDTFDLLILLSWYTVLSFLRSLASLCIQQIDTCRLLLHSVPQIGVIQLLCTVLCLDIMAAMTCIGLFHGAGYGMVILLTCDCVLLAFDTISHIVQYYQSIIDVQHAKHIQTIDDQLMSLHYQLLQQRRQLQQQQQEEVEASPSPPTLPVIVGASLTMTDETFMINSESTNSMSHDNISDDIEEQSKDLDRQMDLLEQQHNRKSARIETMIFVLQFMIDILTILHFIHIWTLHGIHFTFIDGVIALHLHSSATAALKKVHDRRATYRIARDMDELFHNATENDLQNAYIAGDVCCICLGTMHYFPTKTPATTINGRRNNKEQTQPTCNVKKVACGHLYHTTCLREVIERARSIEAARCPLCRAPFVPPKEQHRNPTRVFDRRTTPRGTQNTVAIDETLSDALQDSMRDEPTMERRQDDTATTNIGALPPDGDGGRPTSPVMNAEDSIFRFSTEGLLPNWIPLPGFSFEIVRRPPPTTTNIIANAGQTTMNDDTNVVEAGDERERPPLALDRPNPPQGPQQPAEQSLFRRIMLLAGIVQMSPEEEAIALEQLIDMFPQYDRHDLQRALRQRGTIDAVVESILLGVFVGVQHGTG